MLMTACSLSLSPARFLSPSDPKEATETSIWCLEAGLDWIKTFKLKINPDKVEMLLVVSYLALNMGCHPCLAV